MQRTSAPDLHLYFAAYSPRPTRLNGPLFEDATGDPAQPLYELEEAIARLRAARATIDTSGPGVLLTVRAECYLVGHPGETGPLRATGTCGKPSGNQGLSHDLGGKRAIGIEPTTFSLGSCHPSAESPQKQALLDGVISAPSDSASIQGLDPANDPQLIELIAAWANVPAALRLGILAMVRSSAPKEGV